MVHAIGLPASHPCSYAARRSGEIARHASAPLVVDADVEAALAIAEPARLLVEAGRLRVVSLDAIAGGVQIGEMGATRAVVQRARAFEGAALVGLAPGRCRRAPRRSTRTPARTRRGSCARRGPGALARSAPAPPVPHSSHAWRKHACASPASQAAASSGSGSAGGITSVRDWPARHVTTRASSQSRSQAVSTIAQSLVTGVPSIATIDVVRSAGRRGPPGRRPRTCVTTTPVTSAGSRERASATACVSIGPASKPSIASAVHAGPAGDGRRPWAPARAGRTPLPRPRSRRPGLPHQLATHVRTTLCLRPRPACRRRAWGVTLSPSRQSWRRAARGQSTNIPQGRWRPGSSPRRPARAAASDRVRVGLHRRGPHRHAPSDRLRGAARRRRRGHLRAVRRPACRRPRAPRRRPARGRHRLPAAARSARTSTRSSSRRPTTGTR